MSKSKYKNVRTIVDGISFHTKKEAKRYQDLKIMESAGHIVDLELQKRFPLKVNGLLVCTYVADFDYVELPAEVRVIEDAKGVKTDSYKIKKKLMQAVYGLDILET